MKTVNQLMDLSGRKAVVVGGAGHIGTAMCETLMELGAAVAVLDMQKDACDQKSIELNGKGFAEQAIPIPVDIADEQASRDGIKKSADVLGGIDILIHAAAFVGTTEYPGWVVPFPDQTVDAWDTAMRVNITSAFVMIQEAEPHLRKSGHGSIILVSSIHGMVGPDMSLYDGTKMGNPIAYGVSKAGLIQMARYFSTVYGSSIRTNCISPGGVWRNQNEQFLKKYEKRTPFARMATEEDMKGATAFLASDLSQYVTGSNVVVDGGYMAW